MTRRVGRSEESLEHARHLSREAKRRRRGTCESCGAETRYSGAKGMPVSRKCLKCATTEHNQSRSGLGPVQKSVRKALARHGEMHWIEISEALNLTPAHIAATLHRERVAGRIVRVRRGVYALPLTDDAERV